MNYFLQSNCLSWRLGALASWRYALATASWRYMAYQTPDQTEEANA